MKLNNTRQIRAEDFDDEYNQLTSQLGSILNSFMQEVVELSDGRIDFENRIETIKTFEVTVNESGVPVQAPFKVNVEKSGIRYFNFSTFNSIGRYLNYKFSISMVSSIKVFTFLSNITSIPITYIHSSIPFCYNTTCCVIFPS